MTLLTDEIIYDYMFRRELCDVNPLAKLKRAKATTKKGDVLSEDEFNALLSEPKTPQERVVVAVYAWTAARANEIISADQGDVNLGDCTIAIPHVQDNGGRARYPDPPRTGGGASTLVRIPAPARTPR